MRRTMTLLLAVGLVLAAGGQVAKAAGAGVGLEWSIGPAVNISGFDLKVGQQFALDWKVTDSFAVGVWNASSLYRGQKEYTDAVTTTLKHRIVSSGSVAASGIQVLTTLPMLTFLEVGLNIGVISFTPNGVGWKISRSDGAVGPLATFGAPAALNTTAPLLGIAARLDLLKAETKTVTTVLGITAAFNFVPLQDTAVFGTQEDLGAVAPALPKSIDPVRSYDHGSVLVNASIWF